MKKIRTKAIENEFEFMLELRNFHIKYTIVFEIGIKTGLRISDILELKLGI